MAKDLGITPSGYRKIETGETALTVDRLFKLASILGISISVQFNDLMLSQNLECDNCPQFKKTIDIQQEYIEMLNKKIKKLVQHSE